MKVHIVEYVVRPKRDTSAFMAKGLIEVDSKNLGKYKNQSVITSGKIMGTQEIGNNELGLLLVGADYPNQDFTIIIKGKNLGNFYPMKFYKKKWLTVTGKVTKYMGKPAIELIDEKQMK